METLPNSLQEFRALAGIEDTGVFETSDNYLKRWLKQQGGDAEKAANAFERHQKWRAENGIDRILEEEAMLDFAKSFPVDSSARDKEGCPISYNRVSSWDFTKFELKEGRAAYVRYNAYCIELFRSVIRAEFERSGGRVEHQVLVVDLADVNVLHLTKLSLIRTVVESSKLIDRNYPYAAKLVYIVNAPRVFQMIASAVRSIMRSRPLIQVFDSKRAEWMEALLKEIDPAELAKIFPPDLSSSNE